MHIITDFYKEKPMKLTFKNSLLAVFELKNTFFPIEIKRICILC